MTTNDTDRGDKAPEDLPPPSDVEGESDDDSETAEDVETAYSDADEPVDEPLDDDETESATEADVEAEADEDLIEDTDVEDEDEAEVDAELEVEPEDEDVVDTEADEALVEDTDVEPEPVAAAPEAAPEEDEELEEEAAHVRAVEWYLNRWRDIQTGFVDAPRDAVANADQLVADVIDQLTTALVEERNNLATQWSQDGASTEQLRVAFQGYRSFFERLVAT